jgi:tRNA(Ile)-lysidine synthase
VNNDVCDNSLSCALRETFRRSDTIVAAVSGGGDSMAMLHALCMLAPELELTVIAAHFDHQLRSYSHLDADLVFRMAHRWGARVAPGKGDVRAYRLETGTSIEATGRELRYAFLERVADSTQANSIATAHTRDDQVETVLMRILRGSGPRGRRGILAERGRIVRPLLDVTRAELRAYCNINGVPFVDDPSNFNTDYDRNRIRHETLPELRRAFPELDLSLLRIAETAAAEFERGEEVAGRRVRKFLTCLSRHMWLLKVDAFTGLDHEDCLHLVNSVLEEMNARTDVSALHHEMLLDLIAADAGTISYLPGLRVRREHDGIVFEDPMMKLPRHDVSHALPVPGTLDVESWHMEARRIDARAGVDASNNTGDVAYVGCDDLLVVRYPRRGDRMQPFGMKGHKKLSDIFIDKKVPQRKRASTPVVEVDGEIVWVVGVATSERCRINGGARNVVKLTATRSRP